jgi:ribosomal protein L18E
MSKSQPSEQELLQNILQPLLTDFEYWFSRSIQLLDSTQIPFLSEIVQADLLDRVKQAQQEVSVAQMLFRAVDGKVGVEPSQMLGWHQLVTECWQVSMQFRQSQQTKIEE